MKIKLKSDPSRGDYTELLNEIRELLKALGQEDKIEVKDKPSRGDYKRLYDVYTKAFEDKEKADEKASDDNKELQTTDGDRIKTLEETIKEMREDNAKREKAQSQQYQQAVGGGSYLDGQAPYSRGGNSPDSIEQRALKFYGVSHVKDLACVNVSHPDFDYAPIEIAKSVLHLKKSIDIARGIAQLFYGDPMDRIGATEEQDKVARCNYLLESKYAKNVLIPQLKAFETGTPTAGGNWVPTLMAETFIPEFELQRRLIGELNNLPMPSSPYELPTLTNQTTARRGTENVTATDSEFDTEKLTFTAKKFLEYYILSEEVTEDTAPNILETARQELGRAHERAFETSVINGTLIGTTHIDSDTEAGAADLAEKQYNGLRKLSLDNTGNGGTVDFLNGVVTDALLGSVIENMNDFGVNPEDNLLIMGSKAYNQARLLEQVRTVDKISDRATIIKGTLSAWSGVPIIVTGFFRNDLNATGVFDNTTTDRTGLLMIHKRRWYFGTRRPIRMAVRPSRSADDRHEMASYSRVDFVGHPQTADEVGSVYGYNIST